MSRNATASWSGYSHQGKVGILVSLTQINELLELENVNENSIGSEIEKILDDWIIEFEAAEDFDIKYQHTVQSRHQVKAKKNAKYPNDYKDVLGILKYEVKDGTKRILSNGFQICSFDENGTPQEIEVDKDSRFLHTITKVNGFYKKREDFEEQFKNSTY